MKKIISVLLKYGLPIALSVLLVWFFYTHVDMEAIKQSFNSDFDQWWWFVPIFFISIMSHVFRALRWRLQLQAIGVKAPLSAVVDSIFGTYFVNLLVPRLGEVWRAGYIANRQKASFTKVTGSMVGDRLTDTVTVLVLTLITFFLASSQVMQFLSMKSGNEQQQHSMYTTWWFWVAVALMAGGGAFLVWLYRTRDLDGIMGKVQKVTRNLWEGLAAIAKMREKKKFVVYTVCLWGCYFATLYLASLAFDFTRPLGVVAVLVLFVFSSLGMAVPTNGGVGAWQYAIIFGLAIYGIGTLPLGKVYDPQATSFAWVVWLFNQVVICLLGIYAFIHIAIDRKRIAQGRTLVETSGDGLQL